MEHTHYKCQNCDHIFKQEDAQRVKEFHGTYDGCQRCGYIGLSDVTPCEECGEILPEQDVGLILCKKCLLKLVDYDIGYDFITSNGNLPLFMFEYVFDTEEPKKVNDLLMQEIEMMFKRHKVEDFLYNKPFLLDKIKEYVEADFWAFSEYLQKKGGL